MATHLPWSNRTRRCVREISGCATRTSARRSRPIATSLPAAKVRSDPSYRTVRTGGAGGLTRTNCIGSDADAGQVLDTFTAPTRTAGYAASATHLRAQMIVGVSPGARRYGHGAGKARWR